MTCLTRLLIRRTALLFLGNLLLVSILVSLALVDRLIDDLGVGGTLGLLPTILLGSATFAIPLAAITACAQGAGLWRQEGEMRALASAALPLKVVWRPVVGLFAAVALVAIPWFHDWAPAAQGHVLERSQELLQQALQHQLRGGTPMVLSTHERLFTGGFVDGRLQDLIYTRRADERHPDGSPKTVFTILRAREGSLRFAETGPWLDCRDVVVEHLSGSRATSAAFADYRLDLPSSGASGSGTLHEASRTTTLLGNSPADLFEAGHRWVLVGLIPLLALAGLYLGWLTPWSNRAATFLLALVPLGLIYIPLLILCRTMILQGRWAAASLILPVLAFVGFIGLLSRALRGQGLQ